MNCKLITTASDLNHSGFIQLKKSLEKFNWDWELISQNYSAYGSKMLNAYNYAKTSDCTHLFIVDAYDVIVLDSMQNVLHKIEDKKCILFNAEKGCWSRPELAEKYPETISDWKYLNGGCAFVNVEQFIKMFEAHPISDNDNDQDKLTDIFLSKEFNLKLDNNCEIFQSIAFESDDDFSIADGNSLFNNKTKTFPSFIHGNGKTDMNWVYELLK